MQPGLFISEELSDDGFGNWQDSLSSEGIGDATQAQTTTSEEGVFLGVISSWRPLPFGVVVYDKNHVEFHGKVGLHKGAHLAA